MFNDCPQLNDWLNIEEVVPGYHVLCIESNLVKPRNMKIKYTIFSGGTRGTDGISKDFEGSLRQFRAAMEKQLLITYTDEKRLADKGLARRNQWRFFNTYGHALSGDYNKFIGVVLVFE